MKGFVRYAWSKRAKLWSKRGVVIRAFGRQAIRAQYRVAGSFIANVDTHGLRKAANPFIEYEIGRLKLKPAPIATTIRETYAQCNEDLIVEAMLRAKLIDAGRDMSTVRYLEVGGNHPVQTSSTY